MFGNYVTVAFRNIFRHRGYACINIFGLAVGIACCALILLWVAFEFTFDRFHVKADRIYRVAEREARADGFQRDRASSGTPLGPALAAECPSVETAVRFMRVDALISHGQQAFNETGLYFSDPDVFDVFDFRLARGDRHAVLKDPFDVVVTEKFARKYFGDRDPIGQTLAFNNRLTFTITGILVDVPANSHLKFEFLASMSSLTSISKGFAENWDSPVWNYVLLREGTPPEQLEAQFPTLVRKLRSLAATSTVSWYLQPLCDIHLHSDVGGEVEEKTDLSTLYQYAGLALFILLVAGVNYVNLTTARNSGRSREIGLRKVLGGSRRDLVVMYLSESIIVSTLATSLALVLLEILRPVFGRLVGAPLVLDYLPAWSLVLGFGAIAVGVGVAAGIYPAFRLSIFTPSEALKGTASEGSPRAVLRKVLVVFQFALATTLLICTMIGYDQLSYLLNKDLGYNKSGIVAIPVLRDVDGGRLETLRNAFLRHSGVMSVAGASNIPGDPNCYGLSFRRPDGQGNVSLPIVWVTEQYPRTLGLKSAGDQELDIGDRAVAGTMMLNETAVRALGLSSPVGMQIDAFAEVGDVSPMYSGTVAGIIKNYSFRGLNNGMQPMALVVDQKRCEQMLIRIVPGSEAETIDGLKADWGRVCPDRPFTYLFLEDYLAGHFSGIRHFAMVLNYASFVALIVACIGLFGLASYVILQRTKEIGVRRVFGASPSSVAALLSREFLLSVAVANVLSWPAAYGLMRWWLQGFVYRVEINSGLFILAGASTLVIAMVTIGSHVIVASRVNPINALKYE